MGQARCRVSCRSVILRARLNFGAGLTLGVTTRLQFKIELLDTYKNKPPSPTIQKNDVATVLALVYKF